ncbi:MAG TPA: hypothetical protein VF062_19955 [Candidatus Limnocylindrales bacterium]
MNAWFALTRGDCRGAIAAADVGEAVAPHEGVAVQLAAQRARAWAPAEVYARQAMLTTDRNPMRASEAQLTLGIVAKRRKWEPRRPFSTARRLSQGGVGGALAAFDRRDCMTLKTIWGYAVGLPVALTLALSVATPAHADPVTPSVFGVDFAADSGDGCGLTRGKLNWRISGHYTDPDVVAEFSGTVVDHPAADVQPPLCAEDGLRTEAIFTGFYGSREVGRVTQAVDNGSLPYVFKLSGPDGRMNSVQIQVCRTNGFSEFTYCGKPVGYAVFIIS